MKRFLSVIVLVCLTFLALGAKGESGTSIEAELKALKSRVACLEGQVKKLESQLRPGKMIKDLSLTIPPSFRHMPQAPKGWHKRQFNGIDYYVVPLQQARKQRPEKTR
jgi:hypothetical protein